MKFSKKILIAALLSSLLFSTYAASRNTKTGNLNIAEQGMFSAGGIVVKSEGTFNPENQWEKTVLSMIYQKKE